MSSVTFMEKNNVYRPKISIIIPVYQSRSYLSQCLNSVLEQSFTDWEMILIDDGSTDGSGELCDQYATFSNRICVIHHKNAGLSVARNMGLDHASGEYIAMIDSDDILLDSDYLSLLYNAALINQAEIVMCGHTNFFDTDMVPEPYGTRKTTRVLSGDEAFYPNIFPSHFHIDVSHGKLFHHELFREIRYPEGRNMEDSFIMHRLAYPCKKIVLIDAIMYGHRNHDSSVFHSTPVDSLTQDLILGMQGRIIYFESLGRNDLAHYSEQKLLRWLKNMKSHNHKSERRVL